MHLINYMHARKCKRDRDQPGVGGLLFVMLFFMLLHTFTYIGIFIDYLCLLLSVDILHVFECE